MKCVFMAAPVLYMDITFILHTLVDAVLLYLTGRLCFLKIKLRKLILAAVIGGIYGTFCMADMEGVFNTAVVRMIFPLFLLETALTPRNRKDWANSILIFVLLNIMATGILFLLFYSHFPAKLLQQILIWGVAGALLFWMTRQLLRFIPGLMQQMTEAEVEICFGEQKLCCRGFVDTGNSLVDSVHQRPVIVIRSHLIQSLWQDLPEKLTPQNVCGQMIQNEDLKKRLCIVPYCSVGKKQGIMIGFRSDRVLLRNELTTFQHDGIVLAVTEEEIPDCLIPAALL